MKRAALYVRVSTQEQAKHGISVDSQIAALKEYVTANDMIEAGLFNDAGISARKRYTKRPALLQLIEDCKAGKIDVILFTKLDRWFRSVGDYYEVQSILDSYNVPWRAIWEDYETETSAGIFKVNIMLSVAQSEADRTSDRIKAVNDYKRAKGGYVGSAPLGYKLNKADLVIDEETRAAVTAFFTEFAISKNMTNASRKAADHGVLISREQARSMLSSETYAGHAFGYNCEPYITEEQQAINAAIIAKRKVRTTARRSYLFQGLCKCKYCGSTMHASFVYSQTQKYGRYEYKVYKCSGAFEYYTCDNKYAVHENIIEKYLMSNIDDFVKEANIKADTETKQNDSKKRRQALEAKLNRIGERYEDGDITREEYRAKRDAIKSELSNIVIEVAQLPPVIPSNWRDIYKELDVEHKKTFWHGIINRIEVGRSRNDIKVFL